MELTSKDRNELRREIKKRVVHGAFELPKGFSVDDMIDFLLYRREALIKKRDNPAWASELIKKVDKAFGAFMRFNEVWSESKKRRLAKIQKEVRFLTDDDILLGKSTVPFDYKQLLLKAKEYTAEEAKEKLKTVIDLITDKKEAMKLVKNILRLTRGLPETERYKKIIEAVEALERGLKKEVQTRPGANVVVPGWEEHYKQWNKPKPKESEETGLTWLEEQEEELRQIEDRAIEEEEENEKLREEKSVQASKPDVDEDEGPNRHAYRKGERN